MSRTFTIEEANALVPLLASTFLRTGQLLGAARAAARRLAAAGVRSERPGELPSAEAVGVDPDLAAELARARMLLDTAADDARSLEKLGLLVRDIERGLVDFRTVMDGEREVFLCWKIGERDVRYWHDAHAGVVGRQPTEGHRFFRARQLRPPPE